jgi:phage tail-like protein
MALAGALGVRTDPLIATNFLIMLVDTSSSMALAQSLATSAVGDVALGGFSECTGLEMQLDAEEYREGGRNGEVLQFPTRVKWGKITLKKGMGIGSALWDWHYGFAQGTGKRRDGVIVLTDNEHLPAQSWYFRRGLPVRYSGPALNAAQNAVAIESIEIVHEGILQFSALGTLVSAVGVLAGGF